MGFMLGRVIMVGDVIATMLAWEQTQQVIPTIIRGIWSWLYVAYHFGVDQYTIASWVSNIAK